jgi:BlaI family penicillinase repressor
MAENKNQLTGAEWQIIKAVWKAEPCAAPAIQEALQRRTGWSYSTVKTLMDRMVTKGLLRTKRVRNIILYSAAITKKQAQRGEILRTVKRAFDGALAPMMQFLLENNVSKKQLDEIEKLIKSKKQKAKR